MSGPSSEGVIEVAPLDDVEGLEVLVDESEHSRTSRLSREVARLSSTNSPAFLLIPRSVKRAYATANSAVSRLSRGARLLFRRRFCM